MATLKLEYTDATELEKIESRIKLVLRKIAERITALVQKEVRTVLEEQDIVASGALKKAITKEVTGTTLDYAGRVFVHNRIKYAESVIEGQSSGTAVSPSRIKQWMQQKRARGMSGLSNRDNFVDLSEREFDKVAVRIARSIARKGTVGVKFFEIALRQVEPKILNEARKVVSRYL
jgi:hypothetical protein